MAPSGRSSPATSSKVKTGRKLKPRRSSNSLKKKKKQNQEEKSNTIVTRSEEQEMISSSSAASCCSTNNNNDDQFTAQIVLEDVDISDVDENGFSTPKAQRFRIPEASTCPPPPKKPKSSLSNFYSNNNHRSPIPFFASPELELFFLAALRDISV